MAFREVVTLPAKPIRLYRVLCFLSCAIAWSLASLAQEHTATSEQADLLLRNTHIITMAASHPSAQAVAIQGERILWVGSDAEASKGFPSARVNRSGYTTEAVYAEFDENAKGSIEAGKLADFTIIDKDIAAISPKETLSIKVLRTFIGGKPVYEAKSE
jgi:predicted amidohydrolase YtcJ